MAGAETFRVAAEAYDRFVGRYGPRLARAMSEMARVTHPGGVVATRAEPTSTQPFAGTVG